MLCNIYHAGVTCPGDYKLNPFSGTCLRLHTTNTSWTDAKDFCKMNGEHLATFETSNSANWFVHQRITDPGKTSWSYAIIYN